ncbi:MAG: hypothetical protein HYT61_03380 [Candidatus Yanofskybacteria bacterium]|nr:hypothetical protein [Candidatus Yanofskybacteria bacterium]
MFKKYLIFLLLSTFYLLFSNFASAAKLYFSIPGEIEAGQIFSVKVLINPEEFINAIESKIKFDPNLLEYKDFSDANSLINLWVDRPALIGKDTIKFSGIIPGGEGPTTDKEDKIIDLSFLAKKTGEARIFFEDFKVYLHQDGGQEAPVTTGIAAVNILEAGDQEIIKTRIVDFYAPEKFEILITKNENLFDGARVAVFSAQDKGSGISHYEVKEKTLGLFGQWREADSPYVLRHLYPFSIIEIKAVDKVGLARIEKFVPHGFAYLAIGTPTFLVILFFSFLTRLIRRAKKLIKNNKRFR